MSFQLQYISIPYLPKTASAVWNQEVRFEKGKHYHIKAASGKGKSSLIHTLYGLQKKYEGTLMFEGNDIKRFSINDWCECRMNQLSIVFQDLKLFETARVLDNVELKCELTNYYPKEKVIEFAKRLHIDHLLGQELHTLSYGERQRVAIIRALMQPFRCLLLDEPFSHLDDENIIHASLLIREEATKRNATLIMANLEDDDHFIYHRKLML